MVHLRNYPAAGGLTKQLAARYAKRQQEHADAVLQLREETVDGELRLIVRRVSKTRLRVWFVTERGMVYAASKYVANAAGYQWIPYGRQASCDSVVTNGTIALQTALERNLKVRIRVQDLP